MPESFHTRLLRWKFNWFPPYRGSGARITYIDATLREVRLRLPLNRRTRNLNGTIYGGSIYSAVDPIHAVMLAHALGPKDYVAWTKEAHIRFRRQGRTALSARFVLEESEVETSSRGAGRARARWNAGIRSSFLTREGHLCANCATFLSMFTPANRGRQNPCCRWQETVP